MADDLKTSKGVEFQTEWADPLPENCPPCDSLVPKGETFFRLVEANPPTEIDFYSYRKHHPERPVKQCECIVRALSVTDSIDGAKELKKLPKFKQSFIASLNLAESAGLVKQTGNKGYHFSWWRRAAFNPLDAYQMEES